MPKAPLTRGAGEFTYNNRGLAYAEQGDYQQAISDYNLAIQINPQYAKAYGNRGNAYAWSLD